MNVPHDLEQALALRAAPRAPHDLAERIIYRAVRTPQAERPTWRGVLAECLALFLVPRPMLAFGLCLMIGVFSGWAVTQSADADDDTQMLDMTVIEEDWI